MQKYSVYKITNTKDNGVYYGYTNNFKTRKDQHLLNIKNKKHLNPTFLEAVEKYHWTDFQIEEIEKFDFQVEARLKEKELIIMSDKNPNDNLYNERIPTPDAYYLTMRISDDLIEKFLNYAKKNNLNRSELTRIIIRNYLNDKEKTTTWTVQEIKNEDKTQISTNLTSELLKKLESYSKKNKISKKIIYHSAIEQFFNQKKT